MHRPPQWPPAMPVTLREGFVSMLGEPTVFQFQVLVQLGNMQA